MKFAIAALLGLASVQALTEDKTIAYADNLKCGDCIRGGFNFCIKGKDGQVVKAGESDPGLKCVRDAAAAEAKDALYKCSMTYTDKDMALTICPQRQSKCGTKQQVDLSAEGETDNLEVKNLKKGESCTFKIKAKCGAPGFKVKDGSTSKVATDFDITYVEFDSDEVTKDTTTGKPKPNQSFTDQGKQTKGQKRPPRKDSEGNTIKSKDMGKADDDRKPPPAFQDASKDKDTYTEGGYGKPSSGTYDPAEKGYKTFGTLGQGNKAEGAKDRTKGNCVAREQYVTITAKKDTSASDTVLLEVGSFAFDTTGAMAIKAAAASLLVAFSVSQF